GGSLGRGHAPELPGLQASDDIGVVTTQAADAGRHVGATRTRRRIPQFLLRVLCLGSILVARPAMRISRRLGVDLGSKDSAEGAARAGGTTGRVRNPHSCPARTAWRGVAFADRTSSHLLPVHSEKVSSFMKSYSLASDHQTLRCAARRATR